MQKKSLVLKFIYSEKATKFCEIFPLLLTAVHTVKSKGKISQNFVAPLAKKCQNRIFTPVQYALYTARFIGLHKSISP